MRKKNDRCASTGSVDSMMNAKIILHPSTPGYCKECVYYTKDDGCTNKDYSEHIYEVCCVWRYCKFKKVRK